MESKQPTELRTSDDANLSDELPQSKSTLARLGRGKWSRLLAGLVIVVALLGAYGAFRSWQAARAALDGKNALVRAEADLNARRIDSARKNLTAARASFQRARSKLDSLGPVGPVARVMPLIRRQVQGAEAFADSGLLLSTAGLQLTDTVNRLTNPADPTKKLSGALDDVRALQPSLQSGIDSLDAAIVRIASLDGYRLLGPLGAARDDLSVRLPRIRDKAVSAQEGVAATVAFLGGSGPRRYLLFSQNPDEVRPTGGYLGTYGVLSAAGDGHLTLDRYDNIANWTGAHPEASIPPDEAPSPFPFLSPKVAQSLANSNALPDWPTSARTAMDIWQRGGEAPVDGAIAVTPGFLARILAVVGPTAVPSYGETVTSKNVIERFEYHTKLTESGGETNTERKQFIVDLAEQVFTRLLDTPSSKWDPLAKTMGQAFDARDVVAWFADAQIQPALTRHSWDGALPQSAGDFFADAEFEFGAKNGRSLQRTYDHAVELHADGSARVTTNLTIANPEPPGLLNVDSLSYLRVYGPEGATLSPDSDEPVGLEPAIAGHPAAAWFVAAPPMGQTSLKVVWDVPHAAARQKNGAWQYSLRWVRVNDHSGDVLHLRFTLPKGWRWKGPAPPATIELEKDVRQSWSLSAPG